jgi:hypothetical protein
VKPQEVEALLVAKFHFTKKRKSGHVHYELRIEGVPPIRTHVSNKHSEGNTVGEGLFHALARELYVRRPFLDGMLRCTNSCEAYYKILHDDPYPPFRKYR